MNRQRGTSKDPEFLHLADSNSHPKVRRGNCDELLVTVLFTTVPATLSALRRAGQLAHELGARIRILVPHVVPYPLPLNRPPVDAEFKVRHFRTVSIGWAVEAYIDVWLCRDPYTAVLRALLSQSILLIGGRKHWWATREQRWARKLGEAGHHVIFVAME